jgi:hypothetical protein
MRFLIHLTTISQIHELKMSNMRMDVKADFFLRTDLYANVVLQYLDLACNALSNENVSFSTCLWGSNRAWAIYIYIYIRIFACCLV